MDLTLQELNKNLSFINTDICNLAKEHGTDKSQYSKLYYQIMKNKRKNADVLEIGIYRGASIKLWNDFFESGKVCGIDNGRLIPGANIILGESNERPSFDDMKLLNGENFINSNFDWLETERIKCAIADQRNPSDLQKAFTHFGTDKFDFIIDDGHHFQEHQQKSFGLLFKNVKPGGYFFIEDVGKLTDLKNYFIDGKSYWGQKNSDLSDCTEYVFKKFMDTGIFSSEYISKEDSEYISSNIADIFIFSFPIIESSSNLIVVKKK